MNEAASTHSEEMDSASHHLTGLVASIPPCRVAPRFLHHFTDQPPHLLAGDIADRQLHLGTLRDLVGDESLHLRRVGVVRAKLESAAPISAASCFSFRLCTDLL